MNQPLSPLSAARSADIKITDVIAHPVSIEMKNAFTSWGTYNVVSIVLVEIRTDAGITGIGECLARFAPAAYSEAIRTLYRPRLLGKSPLDIARHAKDLRRALSGRAGGMAQEAMAGIDIALWDILGKIAGLPLYRLLGGIGRQSVPAYGSSIGWFEEHAEAEARLNFFKSLGFKAGKVKIGLSVSKAIARIEHIRKAAGDDFVLSVDANWAFNVDQAMVVGRALEANGYEWFEEPIAPEDIDGYRRLSDKLDIPLACGESDFNMAQALPLMRDRVISVVQPNVSRAGGVSETSGIYRLADSFGVEYAPHVGMSGIVCEAASLHLAAAAPNLRSFECGGTADVKFRQIADIGPAVTRLVDGEIPVPQGPGLGIEIDWDRVKAIAS